MKASVLVHTVDRPAALRRCLDSILEQDHRPLELVLLNAGHSEESAEIIRQVERRARSTDIDFRHVKCEMAGVSRSRNMAVAAASGEVLVCLDDDARFCDAQAVAHATRCFEEHESVGLVAGRILLGDTSSDDPHAWVYRRSSQRWAERVFAAFTFAGALFAVRSNAFRGVGGFWEQLRYSREEEDFSLGLLDGGWQILYDPRLSCRHYLDRKGRLDDSRRRQVEMTNGLLVLHRRLPQPVAYVAVAARIASMTVRALARGERVWPLWSSAADAAHIWRSVGLRREPISWPALFRYVALHRGRVYQS